MKIFFMCFLLLAESSSLYAQSGTGKLTGTILNESGEFLTGATVSILTKNDSLVMATIQSGEKGGFQFFSLRADTFLLRISFTGFMDYVSFPISMNDSSTVRLPVIVLKAETKALAEVTIVIKKPLLEQDLDKTIVNVDAMVGSASDNSLEVLSKTPGVTIDENGALALNGKTGVLVLIDGRPTYMSSQDLAKYLRSLPGALLDKIELIDNPSVKYDAEGAAVINIRLKKTKRQGFAGSIGAGVSQGTYFRNSQFLSMNNNLGKINWFGSFAYDTGTGWGNRYDQRIQMAGTGVMVSEIQLENRSIQKNKNYLGKFGVDFFPSKSTALGFQLTTQSTPRIEYGEYASTKLLYGTAPDSISSGQSRSTAQIHNIAFNANLLKKFSAGGELSADLNYVIYNREGNQSFTNFVGVRGGAPQNDGAFIYLVGFKSKIYNFKFDYVLAIQKQFVLEAGLKSSFVQNDNDFRQFNLQGNQYNLDLKTSNRFLYDENINAGYVSLKSTSGRLRWQLGLRVENMNLKGDQLGNDSLPGSAFLRNFTNVFPGVFLQYRLDSAGRTTLQLAFTRKIARPNFNQYNPFLVFVDPYTYTSGNPSLLGTYPDGYALTLQHRQYLSLRVGYGLKQGLIMQAIDIKENVFYRRPENLGKEQMYFATVGINFALLRWLNLNYNFQFRHFDYTGFAFGKPLDVSVNRFGATLLNQFTLGTSWTADFDFDLTGKDFDDQAYRLPRYSLSGGIQKKLWGGQKHNGLIIKT
jgi:hypothetical protein